MSADDQIIIERNRKQLWFLICRVSLVGCYGFYVLATMQIANPLAHAVLQFVVAALLIVLVLGVAHLANRLIGRRPGLVLDRAGVTFNPRDQHEGHIRWNDVEEVTVIRESGTPFVMINVKNPEEHLNRGNLMDRIFSRLNYRWYGSPIHLSNSGLEISFEALEAQVRRFFNEHQASLASV